MSSCRSQLLLVLLILSLFAVVGIPVAVKSNPGTIIVPDDYPAIQEAINHANDGDTVFVRSGTYFENVVVDKPLSVVGENENATVIDGNGTGTTVQVTADNVTVSRFTVQHSGAGYSLTGAISGIQAYRSKGSNIEHNKVRNNYVGISLTQSTNVTLTANSVYDNYYGFGVTGNSFSQFDNNVDTNNTVDGKSICYLKEESNVTLNASSNAGTVYLINCRNITIEGLSLDGNYYGIFLWNTTGSYVTDITAMDNYDSGIRLELSSNNTIARNDLLKQAWSGIRLVRSENNSIIENFGSHNLNEGIYSWESSNNRIASNVLSYNNEGLYLTGSDNAWIFDNLFEHNSVGASVYSLGSTLVENVFKENGVGIRVLTLDISCNVIYHNNFIQNGIQALPVNKYHSIWDNGYPYGGNYWSDYTGADLYCGPYQNETGSDGVGDTPYVIGTNNQDNYPLVKLSPISTRTTAVINIEPSILNLKLKGKWITAYIELTCHYDASDINITTVVLNNTIPAESTFAIIAGQYGEVTPILVVGFNRTAVQELILSEGVKFGTVTLSITGQLSYGKAFEASDTIRVRMPGDTNFDGRVEIADLAITSAAFGSYSSHPRWSQTADQNEDGKIDIGDVSIVAGNYGKCYT